MFWIVWVCYCLKDFAECVACVKLASYDQCREGWQWSALNALLFVMEVWSTNCPIWAHMEYMRSSACWYKFQAHCINEHTLLYFWSCRHMALSLCDTLYGNLNYISVVCYVQFSTVLLMPAYSFCLFSSGPYVEHTPLQPRSRLWLVMHVCIRYIVPKRRRNSQFLRLEILDVTAARPRH
jgi:hypothetical protein